MCHNRKKETIQILKSVFPEKEECKGIIFQRKTKQIQKDLII